MYKNERGYVGDGENKEKVSKVQGLRDRSCTGQVYEGRKASKTLRYLFFNPRSLELIANSPRGRYQIHGLDYFLLLLLETITYSLRLSHYYFYFYFTLRYITHI